MKRYSALLILILWPLSLLQAQGFFVTAFWGNQVQVKITTGAQTNLASLCSANVIIEHQNASGTPTNAAYDMPITLTTTGTLQIFSDSMCLVPVSAATITSGTSSTTVYLLNATVQASTLTASGPGIADISQTYTTNTNNWIWKGTVSSDWSNGLNWSGSGGAPPGASNVAVFDGTCGPNCSPTMAGTVNPLGIRMNSGYAGTINQAAINVSIGTIGVAQASGTFSGAAGTTPTFTITNGNMGSSGGVFTAPAGTMTIHGGWASYNSPTITAPANSTVTLDCGSSTYTTCYGKTLKIQTAGPFENLNILGRRTGFNLNGGTVTVAKNLVLADIDVQDGDIDNGTINLGGNLTMQNDGHPGTAVVVLTGNPAGQTVTGVFGAEVPGLEIATGANPVTLSGLIDTNYFKMTSVGSFTTSGSTLDLHCGGATGGIACYGTTVNVVPGTASFGNVTINGNRTTWNLGGGTMTVAGSLTFGDSDTSSNRIDNGVIRVSGDITQQLNGYPGTSVIVATGNASGQTISGVSGKHFPGLDIAAGSNPVTLSGTLMLWDYNYVSAGTITTSGSTLDLFCYNNSYACYVATTTINLGPYPYNDVVLRGNRTNWDLSGGTSTIAGNFTFGETSGSTYGLVDNGTIRVNGNITQANFGYTGTAMVVAAGNPLGQTITGNDSTRFLPLIIDAGGNSVTLNGSIKTYSYGVNSVGALVTAGSTLHIDCPASTPCRTASGTVSPGNATYDTVIWEGYRTNWSLAGGTLNVSGPFSFGDNGGMNYGSIDNGEIRAGSNITMINNGYRGNGTIIATGNVGGQTISGSSAGYFPQLKIDSGVNATSLSGSVRVTGVYMLASASNVVTTGSNLEIHCQSASFTNCYNVGASIVPGTVTYNNVLLSGYKTAWDFGGGTMTVAGTLTIGDIGTSGTRALNNVTFQVYGGMASANNGTSGSASFQFLGANSLNVDLAGVNFPDGTITVNMTSPGWLAFDTNAPFNGTNQKLNLTGGSISMGGHNLTIAGTLTLNAGTEIHMGGGTLSYGALNNSGTIVP